MRTRSLVLSAFAFSLFVLGCVLLLTSPILKANAGGCINPGYTPTPGGCFPLACVHQVPNGTFIDGNTAIYQNGTQVTFPSCDNYQYQAMSGAILAVTGALTIIVIGLHTHSSPTIIFRARHRPPDFLKKWNSRKNSS